MTDSADVVIIGGGPVGAALARALADAGIAPVLLEARIAPVADRRPLALSYGSRLILERLGAWRGLETAAPMEAIHVSQSGGFGRAVLTAREAGLPALGYVVDYSRLLGVLTHALDGRDVRREQGVRVIGVRASGGGAAVDVESQGTQRSLQARLVVLADGGALPGAAPPRGGDYGQVAVAANVCSELPHRQVAFERFTREGPLALLPFGAEVAVVWTTSPERGQLLCDAPGDQFCAELRRAFGGRLGEFSRATPRACFPLALRFAARTPLSATVLVGNAAQTLHPVAGQGFNLGLRDAWELADEIRRCDPAALGGAAMLASYRRRRRLDRSGGIGFTDALVRLFSNDVAPLRLARGVGLTVLGCMPPARDFVARRMIFGSRG